MQLRSLHLPQFGVFPLLAAKRERKTQRGRSKSLGSYPKGGPTIPAARGSAVRTAELPNPPDSASGHNIPRSLT